MNHKLWFPSYRTRYVFVSEILAAQAEPVPRMLHLGSGEGDYDPLLSRYTDALHSCDINERDVAAARALNRDLDNVEYRVEDGQALSYPDEWFDTVVCLEVIEHVADPQALLGEIRRVLRPGGRLVLTCPSHHFPATYDPINRLLRRFGQTVPVGAYGYGHTWLVDHHDMLSWLRQHGLAVVEYRRLSRHLVGLVECYLPGLAQRLLKANADNRSGGDRAIALTPTLEEPPFLALTDWLIAADERLGANSRESIGLAYVAEKPDR